MVATSFVFKIFVFSELILLPQFGITLTSASVLSRFRSISLSHPVEFSATSNQERYLEKIDEKGMALTASKPVLNIGSDFDQHLHHSLADPLRYFNSRSINALVTPQFTLDKVVAFITTVNNLLNSRTNNTKLDKLTKTYRSLHRSRGYIAFKNLLSLWADFINSIDVMSNIFRAYETRALNSKELNKPPESNPLEALKSSIDDANTNFAEVANLIQTLKRMGEFDDIFADKQDDDDNKTKIMQQQPLLQDMPLYEEDNEEKDDDTGKNLRDDDDNEEDDTEGPVSPGRNRLVNIYQNYPHHPPAVQPNSHFYFAQSNYGSHSSNSWQNRHVPPDRMVLGVPR